MGLRVKKSVGVAVKNKNHAHRDILDTPPIRLRFGLPFVLVP